MTGIWHRRAWFVIAALAICAALALMLVPSGHTDTGAWLVMLPIFFVGTISPLSLMMPLPGIYRVRVPETPALPATFQRPPPFLLG